VVKHPINAKMEPSSIFHINQGKITLTKVYFCKISGQLLCRRMLVKVAVWSNFEQKSLKNCKK